jgi:glycosyltransferase involved in cell wall biosynthesis
LEHKVSLISIVIPVLNEEESLVELHTQITEALEPTAYDHEILFIDDGSTDRSSEIILELNQKDRRVKLLKFQRNYGKAAALNIGFERARGDYIITMDGDLQDDPAEIVPLIEAIYAQGKDMISGWKKERHDPFSKTIPSKFYNYVTSKMSGIPLHDFNCGLKAYKASVIKNVDVYGEMHRYIPVLAKQQGFTCGEKVVQHRARKYGTTKYGLWRFISGPFDLMTVLFLGKYLKRPLHFFGILGLIVGLAGFGILSYISYLWFMQYIFGSGQWIGNRPIFFVGILLAIIGVQFVSMGLLGEIMANSAVKEKPKFTAFGQE